MVRSPLIGIVLAAALAGIPLAPPMHVHETEEHGHHHALVHRHTEAHERAASSDRVHVVDDDDDEPILTLDEAFIVPATPVPPPGPAAIAATVLQPATVASRPIGSADIEPVIHGPPRAPAFLRGPPVSTRL